MTRYLSSQPSGMTEAPVWLSQCFSDSCTLPSYLCCCSYCFFLALGTGQQISAVKPIYNMAGSFFPSGKGGFVCNRWECVGANRKLCVIVTPQTLRVLIRVTHSVIHTKEDTKLVSGKEIQKILSLCQTPVKSKWGPKSSVVILSGWHMKHNGTAVLLRASRGYCSSINHNK